MKGHWVQGHTGFGNWNVFGSPWVGMNTEEEEISVICTPIAINGSTICLVAQARNLVHPLFLLILHPPHPISSPISQMHLEFTHPFLISGPLLAF